jgi:hypothetical protein
MFLIRSVFRRTFYIGREMAARQGQGKIVMLDGTLSEHAGTMKKGVFTPPHRLVRHSRYPETSNLPIDAESRMVAAVRFASHIGAPVQTMLTINAAHLQRMGAGGVFGIGHLWDGYRDLLELLRKWITSRGIPWSCIWVREYTGGRNEHHGEHWHITFHLPAKHQAALADQVAIWTEEAIGAPDGKAKCIMRSATGAWYLSKCKGNAATYLGKATPKTRKRYGRNVQNHHRQTRHYGGEGPVEGKRFGISRLIGQTAQTRSGWVA